MELLTIRRLVPAVCTWLLAASAAAAPPGQAQRNASNKSKSHASRSGKDDAHAEAMHNGHAHKHGEKPHEHVKGLAQGHQEHKPGEADDEQGEHERADNANVAEGAADNADKEQGDTKEKHGWGRLRAAMAKESAQARAQAVARLRLQRDGKADALKSALEARASKLDEQRKAHWAALKATFEATDLEHDKALSAELRVHAQRIAQLSRIAALAQADAKAEIIARVDAAVQREDARHEKHMQSLAAAADKAKQPEQAQMAQEAK